MPQEAEPPSADDVRQHLQRLVASPQLHASASLIRFLTFTVEEALEGRAEQLKEYIIGVEVFQRGADFDPRVDPIVRVQARKLRDRLAEYYSAAGVDDTIEIDLPKGGYVPIFRLRDVNISQASPSVETQPPVHEPQVLPPPPQPRLRIPPPAYLMVFAGFGVGVWLVLAIWDRGTRSVEHTMDVAQITFDNGSAHPAVSRDGNWLVYESDQGSRGDSDIWVRPLKGGTPSRLSRHESADTTPDISPDGTLVVFRSNRDEGGIFTVPLTGGEERRIAGNGYSPRFSPDGAWVAFSGHKDIVLVPAAGGEIRNLNTGIAGASFPLWSEDGKYLLFLGRDASGRFDWWASPFGPESNDKPEAIRTGLAGALARQHLPELLEHTSPSGWYQGGVLTSLGGSLWRIPISTRSWTVEGTASQVLPGPGVEFARVIRTSGPTRRPLTRLVFTVRADNVHIWGLTPADDTTAPLTQLTRDISLKGGFDGTRPALSADGNILVYASGVSGNLDIWTKDLRSGEEAPLTTSPLPEDRPVLRRDGSAVAYLLTQGSRQILQIAPREGGTPRRICENCGRPNDFSPDGKALLVTAGTPRKSLLLLTLESGEKKQLLKDPRLDVIEAAFSPGASYLAISYMKEGESGVQASLVPYRDGIEAEESRWLKIVREPFFASLHFSADGRTVYYFSTRDNSRCLWAQPVPAAGSSGLEKPRAIHHFHAAKRYPWNGSWLAVGENRVAMTLSDIISNIWTATPRTPGK